MPDDKPGKGKYANPGPRTPYGLTTADLLLSDEEEEKVRAKNKKKKQGKGKRMDGDSRQKKPPRTPRSQDPDHVSKRHKKKAPAKKKTIAEGTPDKLSDKEEADFEAAMKRIMGGK